MKFGSSTRFSIHSPLCGVLLCVLFLFLSGDAFAQDTPAGNEVSKNDVAGSEAPTEEDVGVPPRKGNFPRSAEGGGVELPNQRLGDRAELDRIIELYMAGSYEQCSSELAVLLDDRVSGGFQDRVVRERGRMYFASCALLEGRRDDALEALRTALEENPLMRSPDSLTFPPPVVSLFLEVRDEVQQLIADREKEQVFELRRENERARREVERRVYREEQLEKLARQESVIAKNSRYVASLPFGVGQFQNGDKTLGTIVLVTETLLLGTAITSALILEDLTSKAAASGGNVADVPRYNSQTAAAHSTMTWSSWALLGASALGILEAHLNFQEERFIQTRERALPKELEMSHLEAGKELVTVSPLFGVGPGGGYLGIEGSF